MPSLKPELESEIESATIVNSVEPRVQHVTPRLTQSRQHQVHRIPEARYARSETSTILNRTHRNPYCSDGSDISTGVGAAVLDRATAYVPGHLPLMVGRYLNQDSKDSPVNERLFTIANFPDEELAWPMLASVREERLVWTRNKKSAMEDSGIVVGSGICGNDNEARNAKVSVMGDSGIYTGSEICGNDNEARNGKLNAYLPPDQGNENLAVFMGGPRKKLKYENKPFDWRTGHERTQPLRVARSEDPQDPQQTEFSGKATQDSTSPAPSQIFTPPMTKSSTTTSQDFTPPDHSQVFSLPIRQFCDMTIQDYESPPHQSHQILNLPANKPFYQSYTGPSPHALQWPHSAPFHSPEPNGQGIWVPLPPSSQVFNQQADPIHSPPNILLWGQNSAASPPSTEWPQQHNTLPEGDPQSLSTVRDLISQQPFAIQSSPGCFDDLGSALSQQDSCSNRGMPYSDSNPMPYATDCFSYDTQYRDDMLLAAQDNGTSFQPPSQENFYSGVSEIQDNAALSQPLCQGDQNSSAPGLSFGQPSTKTASTSFDTSSNPSGISPAIYEPPAFASRPQFSSPSNTLEGVAAAFNGTLEALAEDALVKWPVDGVEWDNVSVATLK